ncbi:hypothetical protein CSB93_2544 [Pseudomonas paraeruginosa]|uniref:Uncharacterized protein n=1 Tax=Pseudomonas paraeruginosa TaxID=2994495 RepID=A0A2R3IY52_9PSED|nr:hypothetical protein CSB93_2544 [Pseudomonas paraeruginosa]AWE92956.1 hypothetical protein CSC28_1316 [Pseudomonas paraeruginosa]PTC38234.1 hypothetical protein CLJ1_1132 [Pseudomonas aeruginosa]
MSVRHPGLPGSAAVIEGTRPGRPVPGAAGGRRPGRRRSGRGQSASAA